MRACAHACVRVPACVRACKYIHIKPSASAHCVCVVVLCMSLCLSVSLAFLLLGVREDYDAIYK